MVTIGDNLDADRAARALSKLFGRVGGTRLLIASDIEWKYGTLLTSVSDDGWADYVFEFNDCVLGSIPDDSVMAFLHNVMNEQVENGKRLKPFSLDSLAKGKNMDRGGIFLYYGGGG